MSAIQGENSGVVGWPLQGVNPMRQTTMKEHCEAETPTDSRAKAPAFTTCTSKRSAWPRSQPLERAQQESTRGKCSGYRSATVSRILEPGDCSASQRKDLLS